MTENSVPARRRRVRPYRIEWEMMTARALRLDVAAWHTRRTRDALADARDERLEWEGRAA
ncbi:hypothetical protein ACFO4E_17525 [Nocardiopsis mangrovi]|uniref:Uncharacterized protein n=1 Tax=Nocardiopsis mangrovi TaxID=1179818 RepID=A0ABV9E255_9ACTN